MALREDQIVRYGRQILLAEVGGKGQERLLTCPVRVLANGPGIDDAVAWLLAGGTPVELAPGLALGGFLAGVDVLALNPDARPTSPSVVELTPHQVPSRALTQVVVGAGIAFRGAEACDDCWRLTREALSTAPPGGPVGSLAALTVQRLVLGWADPLGLVLWTGDRFQNALAPTCLSHRPVSTEDL